MDKAKNGMMLKVVGGFAGAIVLAFGTWQATALLGHTASTGHPVLVERVDNVTGDIGEIKGRLDVMNSNLGELLREQIEQGVILKAIERNWGK